MGWPKAKGSDGDYSHLDNSNSIPKGLIPRLAKAEAETTKHLARTELQHLQVRDRQRNKAARNGWN